MKKFVVIVLMLLSGFANAKDNNVVKCDGVHSCQKIISFLEQDAIFKESIEKTYHNMLKMCKGKYGSNSSLRICEDSSYANFVEIKNLYNTSRQKILKD